MKHSFKDYSMKELFEALQSPYQSVERKALIRAEIRRRER